MRIPGIQIIGVGTPGGIGPGLKDGGGLHAPVCGGGTLDEHLHLVRLAVPIGIHIGLHVDHFADHGIIGEDGQCRAVHKIGGGDLGVQGIVERLYGLVQICQLALILDPAGKIAGQAQAGHQTGAVIGAVRADLRLGEPRPAQQHCDGIRPGGRNGRAESAGTVALHQALVPEQVNGCPALVLLRHIRKGAWLGCIAFQLVGIAAQLCQALGQCSAVHTRRLLRQGRREQRDRQRQA